ncbi:MAG: hypothetical protein A3I03_15535 [Candidatus Rokubacteria bacterium RIFCSPLOWO2_02_FULL_68_19]|nr:MAG: hypothetical protein A3I03_15535 [Candidatus Rokubacteria bacterium RIFCSPLOWO2_02_FULL_68_19]
MRFPGTPLNFRAPLDTLRWRSYKFAGFFAHRSAEKGVAAVQGEGFKMLAEGQQVEFEFTQGPKGLQATKVVKL